MPFQLIEPTPVKLSHINVRGEKVGKQTISAIDVDFELERGNEALALIHPDLKEALYFRSEATEKQGSIDGVETVAPNLRFPKLGPLSWDLTLSGMDLKVIFGTGHERSNIELTDCTVKIRKLNPKEGGTVIVSFQAQTSNVPDGAIDKLRRMLNGTLDITLVQNEELRKQAVIDGTVGHPGAAGAAGDDDDESDENESDGDELDADQEAKQSEGWPFPKDDKSSAHRPRTKRGRDATRAFLDAHAGEQP